MRKICAVFTLIFVIVFSSVDANASSYGKNLYKNLAHRLGRNRTDYPNLSNYEFANFRMIIDGKLYRSSSPISDWGNRNIIADNASKKAGIKTFINLADNDSSVRKYKGFINSYYSTQKIIALGLNMKYNSKKFRDGLARGIKLMSESETPFLIHCSLGRDRTGFVCAMIECLMGANIDEITEDYMISFYNYFGVVKGSKEYNFVVNNEVLGFLASAFGVKIKDLRSINLADGAERYFIKIGVSAEDIERLRGKLGHKKFITLKLK